MNLLCKTGNPTRNSAFSMDLVNFSKNFDEIDRLIKVKKKNWEKIKQFLW